MLLDLILMICYDMLLDAMVSVYSMTIVIRPVYKTFLDRFYPQIYLKHCIYKTC